MKIYDETGDVDEEVAVVSPRWRTSRRAVGVAEYAISDDDTTLVTSGLGSCVAVGITDEATAAGLLHVMLPSSNGRAIDNPAKFADAGVDVLVGELVAAEADRSQLRAKIAGGSEMIAFESQEQSVGDRNVEATRGALAAAQIPVVAEDVGGDEGRTVEFSLSGNLVVRTASAGVRVL